MSGSIDLNADLGEDESAEGTARDIAIMEVVSSCNIACGGHAGSQSSMRRMLEAARQFDVTPGAHPSYPDRANFGRSSMAISASDLVASLQEQLSAITAISQQTNAALFHLKPHGALYNDAQDNPELSEILVNLARNEELALVGMPNTLLAKTAERSGTRYIAEAFVDRRYDDDARLVSRDVTGAVITEPQQRLAQSLALAKRLPVTTVSGASLIIPAETLCLHSDSEGALETARTIRREIQSHGLEITSLRPQ